MSTKTAKVVGEPMNRIDGKLKVTGAATYSTEYKIADAAYAVLVGSTIANGNIASIETKAAANAPGVLSVVTHLNSIKVPGYQGQSGEPGQSTPSGRPLRVFYDDKVYFNGQPVAMVVATTFERALYAASLVKATYKNVKPANTDFEKNKEAGIVPEQAKKNKKANTADYNRGTSDAITSAPVKIEAEYIQPSDFHAPMELHCITAIWETEDRLLLYDKVQGTQVTQQNFAKEWKLPPENIRVIATFVGGAFGSGLRNWPHETAAIIAAKMVKKPVKLVLTREQTIGLVGYRPHTWQKINMGAGSDGKLIGITHSAVGQTSSYEQFTEGTLQQSRTLYSFPNVKTQYRILPLSVSTPAPMRGPGEATGAWALECAMDEMAHALNMDPIGFRLKNLPEKDPDNDKPWSTNYVKECWSTGAEAIGWKDRKQQPGTNLDGDWQIGYGVATGIFGANRQSAKVRGKLYGNGSVLMQCAVTDIGPGTGTAMTQIAMDNLSLPVEKITFQWGNSDFPEMGNEGGSSTVNSVGPAVVAACNAIKGKLLEMAGNKKPEFKNLMAGDVTWNDGKITTMDKSVSYSFEDILKDAGAKDIDVIESAKPGPEREKYSMYSFAAHFAEVAVHRVTGQIKVRKMASCVDAGTIINKKTGGNQMIGGVTGGIGMALMEDPAMDHRYGRYMNKDFANYHVSSHADVPEVDIHFIDKADMLVDPIGSKGIGEIAIIAVAPAIANAIFNATGKRIRELPITPDKLI